MLKLKMFTPFYKTDDDGGGTAVPDPDNIGLDDPHPGDEPEEEEVVEEESTEGDEEGEADPAPVELPDWDQDESEQYFQTQYQNLKAKVKEKAPEILGDPAPTKKESSDETPQSLMDMDTDEFMAKVIPKFVEANTKSLEQMNAMQRAKALSEQRADEKQTAERNSKAALVAFVKKYNLTDAEVAGVVADVGRRPFQTDTADGVILLAGSIHDGLKNVYNQKLLSGRATTSGREAAEQARKAALAGAPPKGAPPAPAKRTKQQTQLDEMVAIRPRGIHHMLDSNRK